MPADERHVDRVSPATTLAGLHQGAAARVERVLVDRAVEHLRLAGEAVLDAVAVVHVPVDDQHPFITEVPARPAGADGDVVEQAKAHGLVALGMVARGADQVEPVVDLTAVESPDAIDHRPGCEQGRCVRVVRGAGVGVQVEGGVGGGGCHGLDVVRTVIGRNRLDRRRLEPGKDELACDLGPVQFGKDGLQSFRRFEMIPTGPVRQKHRVTIDGGAAHQRSLRQVSTSSSVNSRSSGMSWGRTGSRSTSWTANPRPTRRAPGASRARNRS